MNEFSSLRPPLVARQGTTTDAGGAIRGGGYIYYFQVCAEDAAGKLSPPSKTCVVTVVQAGDDNTVTIPVLSWDPNAVGYRVYGGEQPDRMTRQYDAGGTPSSITLTALVSAGEGIPDQELDRIVVLSRRVVHSGATEPLKLDSVSVNTLHITGVGTGWTGYDCSLLAKADLSPVPLLNFRITGGTADTLTVTPNPAGLGLDPGDVIVIRSKPSISGLVVSDVKLALTSGEEVINRLVWIAGPGRGEEYAIAANDATSITVVGPWRTQPDSSSRYIIVEAGWLPGSADWGRSAIATRRRRSRCRSR